VRPVDQTTFGHPGGNCFSACVASLLGIPVACVPYFMGEPGEPGHVWAERLAAWLAPRGLYAMHFEFPPDRPWKLWPKGYYILGGQSPRGAHAVVALDGAVVHDPHPSREGIRDADAVCVILPLDLHTFTEPMTGAVAP
jgi:hypothetical protein